MFHVRGGTLKKMVWRMFLHPTLPSNPGDLKLKQGGNVWIFLLLPTILITIRQQWVSIRRIPRCNHGKPLLHLISNLICVFYDCLWNKHPVPQVNFLQLGRDLCSADSAFCCLSPLIQSFTCTLHLPNRMTSCGPWHMSKPSFSPVLISCDFWPL